MMLAVMEEEKAPAELPQVKSSKVPAKLKTYRVRRPKRAEILDLQEATAKRAKENGISNQEFVSLLRSWTELETLLQALDAAKVKGSGALPKVTKSLAAVAEDDPAAGTQATDPKV